LFEDSEFLMADFLFPNFLQSRAEYAALREFWNQEIWARIPRLTRRDWVTPWFAPQHADLEDGNPIFTAWGPSRNRGLQIIQISPNSGATCDLNWWVDWFGGDASDPEAVRKLVIVCVLTVANQRRIRSMINEWVLHGRVSEHVETLDATVTSDSQSDFELAFDSRNSAA
jgi:hypothetical protein